MSDPTDPGVTIGAEAEPAADARAPAGYEILGELGRGGMGVVYRARQVRLDRLCALKMILSGAHSADAEVARFLVEARAIARLQHPGIVQVFEVGEHDGRPYLALEYCPGGSLDAALARHPLPAREAAARVRALAEAVQAAHAAGVIHRDLKPANVLLTEHGEPKLTDFGLAKKLDEAGATRTGSVMGTPSYMAPEQARGDKDVGPPADVYALGAILYECLAGRPPFRAATAMETLLQVLHDEPVPLRRLSPGTPTDLETIAHKCLEKDPAKRYPSAEALANDLGRYLSGEPIAARPVGRLERGVKWLRRNPVVAGLAAAVGLTLLLGTAVSLALAVWAWDQADRADRNAGDARQAQKAAETARDDLETALARSLLRPLGHQLDRFGLPARWADPEVDAVRELAAAGPRLRLRFVTEALARPTTRRQLANRAGPALRAVVGLDPARRDVVEALLVEALAGDDPPADVAVLVAALGGFGPEAAGRAVEPLDRTVRAPARATPGLAPVALGPLAGRLPAPRAAELTRLALVRGAPLAALAEAADRLPPEVGFAALADAVRLTLAPDVEQRLVRHLCHQAARSEPRIAAALVIERLKKPELPLRPRLAFLRVLVDVADRLDADSRAKAAPHAVAAVLVALDWADSQEQDQARRGLLELAGWLPAETAWAFLADALPKRNPTAAEPIGRVLAEAADRLDPAVAGRRLADLLPWGTRVPTAAQAALGEAVGRAAARLPRPEREKLATEAVAVLEKALAEWPSAPVVQVPLFPAVARLADSLPEADAGPVRLRLARQAVAALADAKARPDSRAVALALAGLLDRMSAADAGPIHEAAVAALLKPLQANEQTRPTTETAPALTVLTDRLADDAAAAFYADALANLGPSAAVAELAAGFVRRAGRLPAGRVDELVDRALVKVVPLVRMANSAEQLASAGEGYVALLGAASPAKAAALAAGEATSGQGSAGAVWVARALTEAAGRLPADVAAARVRPVAEALTRGIEASAGGHATLGPRGRVFARIVAALPAEEAAALGGRVAPVLAAALSAATMPPVVRDLSLGLAAVIELVPDDRREAVVAVPLTILCHRLSTTPDLAVAEGAARLAEVAPAGAAAEALTGLFASPEPRVARAATAAVPAVARRLPRGEAAALRAAAFRGLALAALRNEIPADAAVATEQMVLVLTDAAPRDRTAAALSRAGVLAAGPNVAAAALVAEALRPADSPLTDAELLDLLRDPFAAGPAERVVLDLLERRTGKRLRDVWDAGRP